MQDTYLKVQIAYSETFKRNVVKVGEVEFPCYYKIKSASELVNLVGKKLLADIKPDASVRFEEMDYATQISHTNVFPYVSNKLKFKTFSQKAGCSAARMTKHVNGLLFKHYVASYGMYHVNRFASNRKGINAGNLKILHERYQLLDQVKNDGIYNIAPWCFWTGKTPSELKKEFGKGQWKKLTKFSFYRNHLLAEFHNKNNYIADTIPSSILKNTMTLFRCSKESLEWATEKMKGYWTNKNRLRNGLTIYHDTKRMSDIYNLEFNKNWSEEKMKQKHDEYIRIVNRMITQGSSETFVWYDSFPVKEFEFEGYQVKLLKSEEEIQLEGKLMHHCVGSYAYLSKRKQYLVYSVQKDYEKFSTIGFNFDHGLVFNQHYKKFNAAVDCDHAKMIPNKIIELFNRKEKVDV